MYETLVVFFGTYFIWIVAVSAAILVFGKSADWKKDLLVTALSIFFTYILVRLFGVFYSHEEPYIVSGFEPIIFNEPDNSFPSDHAAIASAIAALVFLKNKQLGILFFVAAVLIGVGRVWGGVHYPIDIIFGLLSGALAVFIANFFSSKLLKRE